MEEHLRHSAMFRVIQSEMELFFKVFYFLKRGPFWLREYPILIN